MGSYFGGSPWNASQLYLAHLPLAYVKNIKTPTLIQHGTGDGRVQIAVSEEFYRALKTDGVRCEMIRYPNSWHSLGSPNLVRDAFKRNMESFDYYIRGGKKPGWFAPQLQ
jgi:dipeptidyl aminopeptidase/acylaminoacyl peptidase